MRIADDKAPVLSDNSTLIGALSKLQAQLTVSIYRVQKET